MSPFVVLVIAVAAWTAWIPATILQKHQRGDTGGTSIFPAPFLPFVAWAIAFLCQRKGFPAGSLIVGGAHLLFLVICLVSIAYSVLKSRQPPK